MNAYKVTCLNSATGKRMTKSVSAASAPEAGVQAISHHMMANCWSVERIVDAQGNEQSRFC